MNTMKLRWQRFVHAWDVFLRSQRPWEQEGPLHWVKPAGDDWELRGSTMPEQTGIGQPRGPLTSFRW